jgi:uncharacterized membrane protein YraQ (UPF0718 family)
MAASASETRPLDGRRTVAGVVVALAVLWLALHIFDPARIAFASNFVLIFSSILVEAMPFILIGAAVSAAIEVFVPATFFERITGLPRPLQIPAAGVAGFAFPVCECGSVPVARRLASKGLSPAASVTFMLAAPILNPVVIASTIVAYRGHDVLWPMVAGRAGLGLICAVSVGWVFANKSRSELLRPNPLQEEAHDHDHAHDGKSRAFFGHLAGDFVFMARYLVLGAAVAAALQTFVPQSVIASVAGSPVVDLLAMMLLAFVLSLCSESDAFVAASFVQFGLGAQLAFLVFGPMLDTKLGFLYGGTFDRSLLRTVAIVVAAVTLAGTLWMQVAFG